jgi:hypothetical protein
VILKVIPTVTETRSLSRSFQKYLEDFPGKHSSAELWKMVTPGTAHILRKILTSNIFSVKLLSEKL